MSELPAPSPVARRRAQPVVESYATLKEAEEGVGERTASGWRVASAVRDGTRLRVTYRTRVGLRQHLRLADALLPARGAR